MGNLLNCHLKGKTCRKWANELKTEDSGKELDPRGRSAPTPGQYTCIKSCYSKIFSATPTKVKIYRKHVKEGGAMYEG